MFEAARLALLAFTKALTLEGSRVAMGFLGGGRVHGREQRERLEQSGPSMGSPEYPQERPNSLWPAMVAHSS